MARVDTEVRFLEARLLLSVLCEALDDGKDRTAGESDLEVRRSSSRDFYVKPDLWPECDL